MSTTIRKIRLFFGQSDARPLITAEQLAQELLRTTILVMILLGIPYHVLVLLSIANSVWVTHTSLPSTFVVQMVGSILTLAVPAYFVQKSPLLALNITIGMSILIIYTQSIIINKTAPLGAFVSVL